MKVRVIRTRYPHWGRFSGINQFLRYIDRERFDLRVYEASDSDEDFWLKSDWLCARLKSAMSRDGTCGHYKLSDLAAEIKATGWCLLGSTDVLHYLDGEHTARYLPLLKTCSFPKTKLVASFHQPPDLLGSLVNRKAAAKLDAVTLVSPDQMSFFADILPKSRIRVISHGIDSDFFKPAKRSVGDRKFKCLTVGHWLRDFKTMRRVCLALLSKREIEFHVVMSKRSGPRSTGLEDLSNVVLYRDHVSDDDLLKLYQSSDLLFMPLIASTANNALLEAIACGLPVITSRLSSVLAYLPGEEAVLVRNNDPGKFIEAIVELAKSPEIRAAMSTAGRKRAEELDWRRIAPQYESLYSQISTLS